MKTKITKQKTLGLIEGFPFYLPGHLRHCRPDERPDYLQHVHGDIYRYPEVKIQPAPAVPPQGKELIQIGAKSSASENVIEITNAAETALTRLVQLARNGNGKALWQFARLACDVTKGLSGIMRENSVALQPIARVSSHWPMLRSTNPHLCDGDEWLQIIQLGKDTGRQLDSISRWKPDYAAVVANELINHIEHIRSEGVKSKKEKFSDFLPPYCKDTAPRWWGIAQKFLLATYPKPEEITELDTLVTAKSKRKFPSTRRVAILEKIRARFLNMSL